MKLFRTAVGLICAAALLICSVTAGLSASAASFSVSGLFSTGAVLQQKVPIKVTGFGETGAYVSVSLSAYNVKTETVTCTVNERGKWTAEFEPRDGSYTKYTLTAKCGKTTLRSTGILFGEVWIAGGESSMGKKLSEKDYTENAKALLSERAKICVVSQEESGEIAETGLETADFDWSTCSDKSVIGLPEIPALFALNMRKELDLPIAVICVSADTSSVCSWLGAEYIGTELEGKLRDAGAYDTADPEYYPSSVYNRLLSPVRDISAAGILWSAGEGDRGDTDLLFSCADALIAQMRDMFRYDATCSFSFIFAQNEQHLDSFTTSAVNNSLASAAAKYPFAYTIPVYDLGRGLTADQSSGVSVSDTLSSSSVTSETASSDISSVGTQAGTLPAYPDNGTLWGRFCGTAAGRHYKTAEYSFPALLKADCDDTGADLLFGNVGDGLMSGDGTAVEGFCLIYADTRTVIPVTAEITGADSVRLTFGADGPLAGASLGYAYGECAESADLRTKSGIPVLPFDRAVNLSDEDIEPLTPSEVSPSETVSGTETQREDTRTMLIVVICIGGALLIAVVGIVVALKVSKRNNSII